MPRVLNTPVFILATVYFVVDGMFSHVTQPITVWLAKKKIFERVRLWVILWGLIHRSHFLPCQSSPLSRQSPWRGICWEPVISSLAPSPSSRPKF